MALYISDANGQLKKVAGNHRVVDLQDVYPVGSIYLSVNSTSPASLFGGSWTQIGEGYALWTAISGAGNTISAGLPNIKGDTEFHANKGTRTGALTMDGGGYAVAWQNNTWWSGSGVSLNASRYNSIYSDNVSTVQPPAYKVYAWRRTE